MAKYPCDETIESLCTLCYTAQCVDTSTCTSGASANSSSGEADCSAYCNVSCNSYCNTTQAYASIGLGYIVDHEDVGDFPMPEVCGKSSGETSASNYTLITDVWTADNWNSLIDKLDTAETVGAELSHGGSVSMSHISSGDDITAEIFNKMHDKICNFVGASYDTVTANKSLITAALANAMKTAYENAQFGEYVCDICVSGDQSSSGGCGCNCSCSCSCNCGCDCPCDCDCGCDCDNPCSCSTPSSTDK